MGGIMLDSTKPAAVLDAIKAHRMWRNMPIKAGAGYVDGPVSEWPAVAFTELRAAGVAVVEITVTGAHAADVADIERGDLTPESGAAWAEAEAKAGRFPTLYVNRSNKGATINAAKSRGLAPGLTLGREFGLWVATLDGSFTDDDGTDLRAQTGVVAVQALSAAMLGIDADGSVITQQGNAWLHLEPSWEEKALNLSREVTRLLREHA
jgi:hypothetical protein